MDEKRGTPESAPPNTGAKVECFYESYKKKREYFWDFFFFFHKKNYICIQITYI